MTLRILIAGGFRESSPWDPFFRALGEHLGKKGVALAHAASSSLGRAAAEGYRKAKPAPTDEELAVFPDEEVGSAALRVTDAFLIAGNGKGLPDLQARAIARRVPTVPLPIEQATSEDLWEQYLRHAETVFPSVETRTGFLALRRTDPRSQTASANLAELLVGLAGAGDLPGGPHVLLVGRENPALEATLRRLLRAHGKGARVERAPAGWMRSPGRALLDAVRASDLTFLRLDPSEPASLYALGVARGAGRPAIALASPDSQGLDLKAMDAVLAEGEAALAHALDRRVAEALSLARAPARNGPRGRRRRRGGKKEA